jgi:hypothetical protein
MKSGDVSCEHAVQRPLKRGAHTILSINVEVEIREITPDAETDGTAGFVWPASSLLANFFETTRAAEGGQRDVGAALAGRRVLELGAGTGVLGIALGALGAEVTITDVPEEVRHIESNIERNSVRWEHPRACRPVARSLKWGQAEHSEWLCNGAFDYVLGADLLYFGGWDLLSPDSREPLLQTLQAVLSSSSQGFLGWPVRHPEREGDFVSEASRRFEVHLHTTTDSVTGGDASLGSGSSTGECRGKCRWLEIWPGNARSGEVTGDYFSALLHEGMFVCLHLSPQRPIT